MTTLKKFREMAGLPPEVRRWTQAAAATKTKLEADEAEGWPADVHKGRAIRDGRQPSDFRRAQWPVSDVEIKLGRSRHLPIIYECSMPADTPEANRYVEDDSDPTGYRALPDPVGMTLSSVIFELRDADTGDVLNRNPTHGLAEGEIQGGPTSRAKLWQVFTPGTSVRVRLAAFPKFYFLNAEGGVRADYALQNNGYFAGEEVVSGVHVLSMDQNGNISIDA